jgi:proline iminopeptidase
MIGGASEREFHAPAAGGDIVGWVSGSGPPALLLHGGPGLSESLADLAGELSGLLTVARYQQRGLAPSVADGDRSVDGHVADAVAVLDALGWPKAWAIGASWGGHLAMHLAVAQPGRVIGLVTLDAIGALPDGGLAALDENIRRRLSDAERVRMDEISARREAGQGTEDESREYRRILWPCYFADPASAPPVPEVRRDPEGASATFASIKQHFEVGTLERGLPQLRMPALIVHGDASPLPYTEAERTAALISGARLRILPGIGHVTWLERPGLVRREMEALLGQD